MFPLEVSHAHIAFPPDVLDAGLRVVERKAAQFNDFAEVGNGELVVNVPAVVPDAPHEKWENGLGELREELAEVEQWPVVERHGHRHVV